MALRSAAYASLNMYPFAPLRPAWDRLWAAVHERAPWTPPALRWDGDVHDHWVDPDCAVAQSCGWPVATTLREHVAVVGAFTLALDGADGHRYRSVLVSNRPGPLDELVARRPVAAVNAPDSLSGWVSLLAATVGPAASWPGPVRWTGGHVDSLRAVRDGDADVASIDALTLALVRRHDGDLLTGLHEVGYGPWVPSLPVVARAGTPARRLDELREAISGALRLPELRLDREELLVDGFAALDETAYRPLVALAPSANVGTFVPGISGAARER